MSCALCMLPMFWGCFHKQPGSMFVLRLQPRFLLHNIGGSLEPSCRAWRFCTNILSQSFMLYITNLTLSTITAELGRRGHPGAAEVHRGGAPRPHPGALLCLPYRRWL
jgi:hypothetical protein